MYELRIDPDKFNLEKLATVRGEGIYCLISPYDVPIKCFSNFENKKGIYTLTFDFIDTDPKMQKLQFGDLVRLFIGRNSNRLYEVQVNVQEVKYERLETSFQFGHSIYFLIMNAIQAFHYSTADTKSDCTELLIQYVRDNWTKFIYPALDQKLALL